MDVGGIIFHDNTSWEPCFNFTNQIGLKLVFFHIDEPLYWKINRKRDRMIHKRACFFRALKKSPCKETLWNINYKGNNSSAEHPMAFASFESVIADGIARPLEYELRLASAMPVRSLSIL